MLLFPIYYIIKSIVLNVSTVVHIVLHNCQFLFNFYEGGSAASLEEVLVFFSGASRVPPGGFDTLSPPSLTFDHTIIFPQASTCALNLVLPAKHSKYEEFKIKMDHALSQNSGFGCV